MLKLIDGRYQGRLIDGRILCVLPDVLEMNRNLPETELFDPDGWLESVDGENCWIEEATHVSEPECPQGYYWNGRQCLKEDNFLRPSLYELEGF